MNWTIATMKDVHNGQEISIDKSGSTYTVWLANTATNERTHKSYKTMDEAYTVFEKLAHAIVTGWYSYQDRKAMLA